MILPTPKKYKEALSEIKQLKRENSALYKECLRLKEKNKELAWENNRLIGENYELQDSVRQLTALSASLAPKPHVVHSIS